MRQNEREKGRKGNIISESWEDPQAIAHATILRKEQYTFLLTNPCRRKKRKLHHFDLKQGEAGGEKKETKQQTWPLV